MSTLVMNLEKVMNCWEILKIVIEIINDLLQLFLNIVFIISKKKNFKLKLN